MTNERKRDEQKTEKPITELPAQEPADEQADKVRGGFVMRHNSASPTLN